MKSILIFNLLKQVFESCRPDEQGFQKERMTPKTQCLLAFYLFLYQFITNNINTSEQRGEQ